MKSHSGLEEVFRQTGFADFKWINADQIVVAQWVRFKCTFGCSSYGRNASCPPNVPEVAVCREFFGGYRTAVLFRIHEQLDDPESRGQWSAKVNSRLLEVERSVFLAGYHKAFQTFMDECQLCKECTAERTTCLRPSESRPGPESLGVDVFATVRSAGYPIEVLTDSLQAMNRYAILLVE